MFHSVQTQRLQLSKITGLQFVCVVGSQMLTILLLIRKIYFISKIISTVHELNKRTFGKATKHDLLKKTKTIKKLHNLKCSFTLA